MFFLWRFPTRFVALQWNKRYVKLPSFLFSNKKLSYESLLCWTRLCNLDWICKDQQDFDRICKVLQGSAIFCKSQQGLQDFARICKSLQGYARFCKDLQDSSTICKILQSLHNGILSIIILQCSSRLCNSQQESAILKKNLQIARFNKNLQYSSRYLIAQELKVLDVFTLTSSESFISLQFRNKRHVKKKIPFSFDAHIVNWLYAASTHFTAKA